MPLKDGENVSENVENVSVKVEPTDSGYEINENLAAAKKIIAGGKGEQEHEQKGREESGLLNYAMRQNKRKEKNWNVSDAWRRNMSVQHKLLNLNGAQTI